MHSYRRRRPLTSRVDGDVPVVLYDQGCRWCRACVEWGRPRLGVRWMAFDQWPAGQRGLEPADLAAALHTVEADRTTRGAAAVMAALSTARSRRWRLLAAVGASRPVRPAAEVMYRLVASQRGGLSRLTRWYRRERDD